MPKPPKHHNFYAMGISSTIYVFEDPGDELPLHVHETFDHISIVIHGTVEFFDDQGKMIVRSVGHGVIFRAGRPHGIRAITPGASVHNVMPPTSVAASQGGQV